MRIYTLSNTEKENINNSISNYLRQREEILFSYLHGSFLEDNFRDIDIAVYLLDEKKPLKYELHLERKVEDLTGFPVDIRILNHAPLSFRFHVIKNGVLIFSRNDRIRCDFESLSIVEYHDFAHIMKNYRSDALGIEI